MNRFEIDDMSVVNWPVTISSFTQLSVIPRMITDMTIAENSMNDPSTSFVSFTDLNSLRSLTIETNSLQHISSLSFSELNSLESLHIGENALTSLTTMTIHSNSLNHLPSMDLTPITSLSMLLIDSHSLNGMVNMTVDGIDNVVIRERSLMKIEKYVILPLLILHA